MSRHRWRFANSNGRTTEHMCSRCRVVRRLARTMFQWRRGWRVVYLAPDGSVLVHGPDARTRVPLCNPVTPKETAPDA